MQIKDNWSKDISDELCSLDTIITAYKFYIFKMKSFLFHMQRNEIYA